MDIISRTAVEQAARELGRPIIVENRAGGGGIVATNAVMQAAPDGHTLLVGAIATVLRPLLDPSVTYDPLTALTPIILLGDTPNVILAGRKYSGDPLRAMVERVRQSPESLTLGHPGPGTMGHLASVFFTSFAGLNATFVGYRSGPNMLPDLIEGRLDAGIAAYSQALKSAKILAVMSPKPVPSLPDVPTTAEAGFPGLEATTWFALFGPPGLPSHIVVRLNAAINNALRSPEAESRLSAVGFQPIGGSPGDLAARMQSDTAHWSKIIREHKIRVAEPQ
jgi:tripartite-type tricarboxylate transporter receptor subunit TctC